MPLVAKTGSHRFVGHTIWSSGPVLTDPTNGTVLVDSGSLEAGNYLIALVGSASVDIVLDLQQRNAANDGTVKDLRRRPSAGDIDLLFGNDVEISQGERIRAVLVGTITGEVALDLQLKRVESYT